MDFEGMRDKAENLAEEHADQVDSGIDKGADLAGERFGHEQQIDSGAERLKDAIPGQGNEQDGDQQDSPQ